ncbi:aldolase [Streptomyces sp. RB6PN25]|uniref:Aldolase n=1 Tax=Streptomyces humicola TaxID=2953240 RepID=A0ABT1Q4I6_9ACTN|nr:aldolase [Streptomyces humicola]MCQ4084836.1 aldolase [Streptomyces humicola]
MTTLELLSSLRQQRLLATVRGDDPGAAVRTVVTLVECGVRLVEVSLTSEQAQEVLAAVVREIGRAALIGAGTVLSAADAADAHSAGAHFAVTPGFGPGVAAAASLGLPVVAGALTPSEVACARSAGAAAIKLFPASLGGADYLRALRQPFPDVPFVPVGGIGHQEARTMLAAGALAVGVGSPLVGDAASGGSLTALRTRAATFLDTIGELP